MLPAEVIVDALFFVADFHTTLFGVLQMVKSLDTHRMPRVAKDKRHVAKTLIPDKQLLRGHAGFEFTQQRRVNHFLRSRNCRFLSFKLTHFPGLCSGIIASG